MLQLIKENKIKITHSSNDIDRQITTFHDPCYMGRYNKDYMSSRNILKSLNVTNTEMPLNKDKSFCCGAGGGRMFMEEDTSYRINSERVNQARSIGGKKIITACPFCKTMLADGAISYDDMEIKDIVELVGESIK